ncbi:helix-turn-helix transcriptional regulator [Clostridium cochlearium]|uniref:DNA-binding protein n=1 Tax=Clostridium cochlearium TaxID=1494 RepID=A0A1G9G419_CLOCO|nr:helix-turn-helix transcriptional regulator [Clostridium cochlearium]MBE6161922.1 helix-turn-helix transcriptional regulator [Bacillota bacterium]MBV1818002.1 helix-turn-helix domain-containing protein [Bacteroidales bacterium MSK.15.36]NMB09943.1 helix-turn-helix transcriptional regulator [Tissierellia bacterium]MCG4580101.1 helix-turn-helix domain-containing protein [Clostridium cochlearium]MDU1442051.1 helix-turn-helix transcriptional regulator [Clostridium cochlearium]
MDLSEALAIVLKKNRINYGLSQEELAYKCNLDRTYISLLERGKRNPTINVIFSISKNLELEASEFIKQVEYLIKK